MAPAKKRVLEIKERKWFYRPFYETHYNPDTTPTTSIHPDLPTQIIVVGCGGNGGYLIPNIVRFLKASPSEMINQIELAIFDGDRVEPKNIGRQNFVAAEEGLFKAEAIGRRCARGLGFDITVVNEFFTVDSFHRLPNRHDRILFIGCVDRHPTRMLISQLCRSYRHIYLDLGNEIDTGQVFMSAIPESLPDKDRDYRKNLIKIEDIYPEIGKADPEESAPSCAEQVNGGIQKMSINVKIAALGFDYFCSLFSMAPIYHYQVTFGPTGYGYSYIDDFINKDKKKPNENDIVEELIGRTA